MNSVLRQAERSATRKRAHNAPLSVRFFQQNTRIPEFGTLNEVGMLMTTHHRPDLVHGAPHLFVTASRGRFMGIPILDKWGAHTCTRP